MDVPTYALLLKANANRVYGESAFDLTDAEASAMLRKELRAERRAIAGVDHLVVEADAEWDDQTMAVLSNISSLHAAYEVVEGGLLRPLPVTPIEVLDTDITTIQRYPGKTNEAFTHLLVNVALAETQRGFERLIGGDRLSLLDPACGRGTTLNRAAVYGMDAHGVDLDQRDVEAYTVFILTWLKDKRLKHHLDQAKLRKGRERPAHRITVTYGPTKDRSQHRTVDIVHDDTRQARTHLKARSIDLLACDLPYGVQHGAHGETKLERGPGRLLRQALPVWFDLLRPGAGVALSWNLKTMPRPELEQLVVEAGFALRAPEGDERFTHRVDRSIHRDVLLAARPAV